MKNLNEEQIKQFYNLNKNITFTSFVTWISESLNAERESSDRLEEFGEMKKSQGYRCALDDILDTLENLTSELND